MNIRYAIQRKSDNKYLKCENKNWFSFELSPYTSNFNEAKLFRKKPTPPNDQYEIASFLLTRVITE